MEDHSFYRAILDALPFGVAFAVPVLSSTKHGRDRQQSTTGRGRAKDFRFVYINEKMEELARTDGGAQLGMDGLILESGDMLGQLARSSTKKRKESTRTISADAIEETLAAESGSASSNHQAVGGEDKTGKKKKKNGRRGLFARLLKAHKHSWRTGTDVEVTSPSAAATSYLVKPLKLGQETVGILTVVRFGAKLFWCSNRKLTVWCASTICRCSTRPVAMRCRMSETSCSRSRNSSRSPRSWRRAGAASLPI